MRASARKVFAAAKEAAASSGPRALFILKMGLLTPGAFKHNCGCYTSDESSKGKGDTPADGRALRLQSELPAAIATELLKAQGIKAASPPNWLAD